MRIWGYKKENPDKLGFERRNAFQTCRERPMLSSTDYLQFVRDDCLHFFSTVNLF